MVRSFRRHAWFFALLAAASGCDTGARPAPTEAPAPPNPTQPSPTEISPAASRHLESLVNVMQVYSIRKNAIDWDSFRSEVVRAAGTAQSIPETYPAIEVALRLLNDSQSYYQTRNSTLGPAPVGGCTATSPPSVSPPPSVGYVKVASCDCEDVTATRFAESVQQVISAADRPGLAGWIVDLRGNVGGNMWPMIAGVGPVMGEGIIGWIVYNNREYEREYRNGAALSLGEAFASVDRPYRLRNEFPKVAVLTDGLVSSAAEAITVYFRGRPGTRSFGTPTCGHHHLQQSFPFSDGGVLGLAVSQHADRTKRQYAGSIEPDEIVTDPSEAASRAIAWLLSGR